MKKLFLIATLIVAYLGVNAQGQAPKFEIAVAYGVANNTRTTNSFYKGAYKGKRLDYWGPVSAEFFYRPLKQLGVGVVGVVSGCKWSDNPNAKSVFITVMPAVKYNWLSKKNFSMYSKTAAGLTVVTAEKHGPVSDYEILWFNFQVSLVGLEFGGALRGFAELGVGEQGIMGGIRYKF